MLSEDTVLHGGPAFLTLVTKRENQLQILMPAC